MATCGDKGIEFLKGEARVMIRKTAAPAGEPAAESSELRIQLEGREYRVVLDDGQVTVNGVPYAFTVAEDEASPARAPDGPRGRRLDHGALAGDRPAHPGDGGEVGASR